MAQAGVGTGVVASPSPVSASSAGSAGAATSGVAVGFTPAVIDVRHEVVLEYGRRRVFDALLHVAAWWPHRVRPGTNIVLEPRVGGRFFEHCDDGCGILLGHVARLVMPEDFAVEGSLGIGTPVTALWNVGLDADGHQRTFVHGRFEAFGALGGPTREHAPAYWETVYSALAHYLDA